MITLDPGMAFGTGLHPTTRGCLELLQTIQPTPARVLDVGSGSGILGLAALRLGADHVVALDTDPLAVEATAANAERNGLGARVEAALGTLPEVPLERFSLVVANLVAAVLIDLAPRLDREGGRSGWRTGQPVSVAGGAATGVPWPYGPQRRSRR